MTDRMETMGRTDHFRVGAQPLPEISQGARQYQQKAGLPSDEEDYSRVAMPKPVAQRVADAYDQLPEHDPNAVPAFDAMRREVQQQYEHMTGPKEGGGMGIKVEMTDKDPYGHGPNGFKGLISEVRDDVSNGRIKVLSSEATGGHPHFSNEDNDKFRAVHDVFGHLGSGRGIDPHGEEAAFQKHARMFSPLAQQALATETRGQNSWVNTYGGGKAFAKQKVALLPKEMQSPQFSQQAEPEDRMRAAESARKRNQSQGIE